MKNFVLWLCLLSYWGQMYTNKLFTVELKCRFAECPFFYLAPLPTDPNSRELCVYPYLLLERSAQQTQNTLRTALKGQTGKDKDLTPSSSFVTPDVQHHIAVPKVKHPCVSACQFAPARTYLEHASRAPSHNHEGWCFTCNALPGSGDSPTPM